MKTVKGAILFSLLTLGLATLAFAQADENNGLVVKQSPYSVSVTLDRLEAILKEKGITIFARVNHTAGARANFIPLRPTELLIFGNPKLGSHFFTAEQAAGIDLPMKVVAWEDEKGKVWLAYNDPMYIVKRHMIKKRDDVAEKMRAALDAMTDAAISP
jgi:uncharacterized protein (DUF302 family)